MAENSHISWTDHTYNPWIGCTNVSPACDHCYAEKLATTRLQVGWGDDAPRRRTKTFKDVRKWQRHADEFLAEHGRYPRVFSASLADIFDNRVPPEWRTDFWALVRESNKLQWLIVTKRMPNVAKMLPADWSDRYRHVVLIITVANQAEADRDVPRLLKFKSLHPWLKVGLSIEPMLGPVDLTDLPNATDLGEGQRWLNALGTHGTAYVYDAADTCVTPGLDWVITGGESKQLAGKRDLVPLASSWVRDMARDCAAAGVPHHFKQWGHTIPESQFDVEMREVDEEFVWADYPKYNERRTVFKDWMGREINGVEHNGFPPALTEAVA